MTKAAPITNAQEINKEQEHMKVTVDGVAFKQNSKNQGEEKPSVHRHLMCSLS